MKNFEELFLDAIRNDINYLFQEVYLPKARKNEKYLKNKYFAEFFDKAASSSEFSLKDITVMTGINVTETYMLNIIKKFCDDSVLFSDTSSIDRATLIPMFKYFIDKDKSNARLISSFFLPIHCSGQMMKIFLDKEAPIKSSFDVNYTLISGIEHYLGSKDSNFGLGSSIYYLNFINYEKKNAFVRNDSEYFNKLNDISIELESFLAFYGSDNLLGKYDAIKNGYSDEESYNAKRDFILFPNNLNLIKHFYNGSLPNCQNKLYGLRKMEESIASASTNRKELLLASFCYRKYRDDDFIRSFDDVELSVDDILAFITECEKSNLKITNKQIGNLLESFKKHYLVKNNLVEDYENEKKCILDVYDRFCQRNWTFEKSDFIDFFNSLYGKKFKTFGFDNSEGSLLTSEILDEVIGNNKFVGFEKIKHTNTCKSYFDSFSLTDREQYCYNIEHRRELFKQYHDLISEYCSDPKVTIHYFIYKLGVSVEDEKTVEGLVDWCSVITNSNSNFYSDKLKKNTAMEIRENFEGDLSTNFRDRKQIVDRYFSILNKDGIKGASNAIRNGVAKVRKDQFLKLTPIVIETAKTAIKNGETGWSVFDDINLSQDDIKYILVRNGVDWHELDPTSVNNAYSDFSSEVFRNTARAAIEYVSTDDCSMMEVCNKYGTFPKSISDYVKAREESQPELYEKFTNKAANNNDFVDNSYIDVDAIVSDITHGITMPNGDTRKYTFFDLVMDIGHSVNLYELKKIFDEDYPNNYFVGNFLSLKVRYPNVHYSYNLRNHEPFAKQIRDGVATINIGGRQHLVTDEEKETVLGFLEERNLPACLFYDATKAYINGEFDPRGKDPDKRNTKVNIKRKMLNQSKVHK